MDSTFMENADGVLIVLPHTYVLLGAGFDRTARLPSSNGTYVSVDEQLVRHLFASATGPEERKDV